MDNLMPRVVVFVSDTAEAMVWAQINTDIADVRRGVLYYDRFWGAHITDAELKHAVMQHYKKD